MEIEEITEDILEILEEMIELDLHIYHIIEDVIDETI